MMRNIIFIAVAAGIYWGLKWACGKRDGTTSCMPNKFFFWVTVALAIGFMFGTPYFGTKTPGSFFERNEYQGMYYVNLFPNAQKVKSYRVPAMISASIESDTDYEDRTYSWREYRIDFATMPNGGRVTFYDSDDEHLELDKTVTMYDDNERYWGVELTNHSVR